jgi:hypothetical protein
MGRVMEETFEPMVGVDGNGNVLIRGDGFWATLEIGRPIPSGEIDAYLLKLAETATKLAT